MPFFGIEILSYSEGIFFRINDLYLELYSLGKSQLAAVKHIKMRILLYLLALLTLPVFITACSKQTFELNSEFTVHFGQAVKGLIDGKEWEIKFIELVEESRCPPDVICIWEGQVAVKIQINESTEAELGKHTTIHGVYSFKNQTIHLLEVNYNKKENFGKAEHCSIRLRVE